MLSIRTTNSAGVRFVIGLPLVVDDSDVERRHFDRRLERRLRRRLLPERRHEMQTAETADTEKNDSSLLCDLCACQSRSSLHIASEGWCSAVKSLTRHFAVVARYPCRARTS